MATPQTLRPATLVGVFLAGLLSGAALTASATGEPYERLRVFAEALSLIEARYVDERPPDALLYDAIGGLTQGLDDHSVFMDPDRYRETREQTSGEYYGVGISIDSREGGIHVVQPMAGSPAEDAGLLPGDVIVAVDGLRIEAAGEDALLSRIKGRRGTIVVLTVRRGTDEMDFPVRRDQVRTRSVESRLLVDGYAWAKVSRFQRRTADELRRALAELAEENGAPLAGLVLDLRGNPGGYLNQAVAVADLWLSDGVIVTTVGRDRPEPAGRARAAGTDRDLVVVGLVDGGSASAAEIVAGALQDHGRARLLGYTTWGKGSVQQFFDLPDGSALKLTTARYYTPSGRSIHGSGIEPDIAFGERGSSQPDFAYEGLLAGFPPGPDWAAGDPELLLSLAFLRDPVAVEAGVRGARGKTDKTPPIQ
jgi:carboxyl-terminal processing protease